MILPMDSGFRFVLLLPFAALLGCTLPNTPTAPPTPPTGAWSNWQIQAGTAITSPPSTYPSFVGAIQTQGSQASGIFTDVYPPGTPTPSSTVFDYTGTFDPTTQSVSLFSSAYYLSLAEPTTLYTLTPVNVIGGCIDPTPSGANCTAIFEIASVGVEIAPLNGTYTGTLTDSATPSLSGAGSLTLTQSTTPNSSGAFALTGTITFPTLGTFPLTGTVSGEGITLNYCSAAVIGPCISLTGSTNPTAIQITVTNLTYNETTSGPPPTFTGTLNN
jgi:hypothetical protein